MWAAGSDAHTAWLHGRILTSAARESSQDGPLLQDGDPSRKVGVPAGFDYELYTRTDIERILGDKAACISFKDSACRCFGYMVSREL